jgi:hypothetical protein
MRMAEKTRIIAPGGSPSEFVGQGTERGLEGVDHLLAVGVRHLEAPAARRGRR